MARWWNIGAGPALDLLNYVQSSLPRYVIGARVKVAGDRLANKNDLLQTALAVAFNRAGNLHFWGTTMARVRVSYPIDSDGENAVQVEVVHEFGEDTAIAADVVNLFGAGFFNIVDPPPASGGFNGFLAAMGKPFPITGPPAPGGGGAPILMTQDDANNPAFKDAGTRGTWLEELVTQALYDPTSNPTAPP